MDVEHDQQQFGCGSLNAHGEDSLKMAPEYKLESWEREGREICINVKREILLKTLEGIEVQATQPWNFLGRE